jgi:hypothetical protein
VPAVFVDRRDNQGFESLALSPDGRTLYAALPSPRTYPDETAGKPSRAVRVHVVDTATEQATAEFVYPLEDVTEFDPGANGDQSKMKVSALAWYGQDQLVVDERTTTSPSSTSPGCPERQTAWKTWQAQYGAVCEWGMPVFVANGDSDPTILPYLSDLLAGLISRARVKIYPDAADGFLFQHHAEFTRDVDVFLGG